MSWEIGVGIFLFILGIILIIVALVYRYGGGNLTSNYLYQNNINNCNNLGSGSMGWSGWEIALLIFGIILVIIGLVMMVWGWRTPIPEVANKIIEVPKEAPKEVPSDKVLVSKSDVDELKRRRASDFVDHKIYEHENPARPQLRTHGDDIEYTRNSFVPPQYNISGERREIHQPVTKRYDPVVREVYVPDYTPDYSPVTRIYTPPPPPVYTENVYTM